MNYTKVNGVWIPEEYKLQEIIDRLDRIEKMVNTQAYQASIWNVERTRTPEIKSTYSYQDFMSGKLPTKSLDEETKLPESPYPAFRIKDIKPPDGY